MGNRPDRNTFVLGPAELTTRELERRLDKNNVDVNEVQEQVAAIEPVVTSNVTSGGVFIGIVSTFDDASQLAQVDVGGTIIPMLNYSGRSIGPSNPVACAYLKDDPTTAVIVGVFRGTGYVTPEYTAPVVPQDFPIYGEGLVFPIIGDIGVNILSPEGMYWDYDTNNELGFGTDAIVAYGRFTLPLNYNTNIDPQVVVVYNKATGALNLLDPPGTVTGWGPVVGPSCFFTLSSAGLYRYNANNGTYTLLGTNLWGRRILKIDGELWMLEVQSGISIPDYMTNLPTTGNGSQLPSRRISLLDQFNGFSDHVTTGGGVIWVCSSSTSQAYINYMRADLTNPSVQRFESAQWGGGRLAYVDNSGADGDGDLQVFEPYLTPTGINYAILCIKASFDGNFNVEAFQDVFDPNIFPLETQEMCAAGSSTKSMYVSGIVLAELIDEAHADSGLVMPAIWETNISGGTASSALIWTGVDHVAPYVHCHGLEVDAAAGKLRWMVVVAPVGVGGPKETYLYDSDI